MYVPGLDQWAHHRWQRWVLEGRRREADLLDGSSTLVARHGWRLRCSYLFFFLLFGLMCAGALLVDGVFEGKPQWLQVLLRGFSIAAALLGAAMVVIAFRERALISDSGLLVISGLRPAAQMSWHEIGGLEPHPGGESLVLRSTSGATRRISLYLDGLGTIERAIAERCGS